MSPSNTANTAPPASTTEPRITPSWGPRSKGLATAGLLSVLLVLLLSSFAGLGLAPTNSAYAPTGHLSLPGPSHGARALAMSAPTAIGGPVAHPVFASTNSGSASVSPLALRAGSFLGLPSSVASLARASPGAAGSASPPFVPLSPSSASNWYIGNYAWLQGATSIGGSSTNLLASGINYGPEANFTTNPSFFEGHGGIGIARSANGGASWKTNWPGQATNWTSVSSPSYGDIFTQSLNPGTGYNLVGGGFQLWNAMPANFPTVVSNSAGTDLLMAAPFNNVCYFEALTSCTTNGTYNSQSGTAVVQSVNGGVTWGTPIPVFSRPFFRPVYYNNGCSGTPGVGILAAPANQTLGFSLAMGGPTGTGSNYAYLAMDVMSISTSKQGWSCSATGSLLELAFTGMNFTLEVSTSSNGGASWGAPKVVADISFPATTLDQQMFPIAPLLLTPHLTVGPAPTYTVHLAYLDVANLSAQVGPFPIAMLTNRTFNTWNAPADSGITSFAPDDSGPDWFFNGTMPMVTADNWSSSPHVGNLYMAYNDNLTQTPGTPSIEFTVNTGAGWSTPKTISAGAGLRYFNPSVAIQPNGTVWVVYLGVNPSNGYYRLYGTYSTNGGANWSGQFPISDQASTPAINPAQLSIGISAVVATSTGAFGFWSDCRSANCQTTSGFFNWTTFTAFVHGVTVSATAASVNATITIGGASATYALPINLGWDTNASVTAAVTSWIPNGSFIEAFSGFSGATSVSSNPATFTYLGGDLVAHYVQTPGSWISGNFKPAVANARLSITEISTSQTVPAKLSAGAGVFTYNVTVPGSQSYTITASAPKYQTQSSTVGTTNFKTTSVNFTMAKVDGWIAGTIASSTGTAGLASAVLTINDTPIPAVDFNRTTGRFNVTEAWGTYWVNVTSNPSTAYVPYKPTSQLTVLPGVTAAVRAGLKGSWINGTVTPYPVTVTINGAPVTLNITGSQAQWVDALPGGTYTIVAHQPGYSVWNQTYTVPAGTDLNLTGSKAITLTNHGNIQGTITPASINGNYPTLLINNATQNIVQGTFNVQETASAKAYNVSIRLLGYNTSNHQILVTPGNTSWLNVTLTKKSGGGGGGPNCNVTPLPPTCPSNGGGGNGNGGGVSTLEWIGIGVIVLLVVVIAAVMLMRRGKGASPPPTSAPSPMDEGVYGATPPASPMTTPGQEGGSAGPPAAP